MSGPTTRRRSTSLSVGMGKTTDSSVTPTVINRQKWPDITGTQITVSEGHPFGTRKGPLRDIGGDFYTTRQYFIYSGRNSHIETANGKVRYDGPIVLYPGSGTWPPPFPPTNESSSSTLNSLGATAIARCKPTSSPVSLASALGELYKDGLPSLPILSSLKDKVKSLLGKSSDEFLNAEFGWRPLVSDVSKFINAVRHANLLLEQYERDAGRVVRRTYTFPEQVTRSELAAGSASVKYVPGHFQLANTAVAPRGTFARMSETIRRQWFSGAFTYYLPTGYDSRSVVSRFGLIADQIYGLELTPEVIWNLAPWSWAADWFGNFGDVISNVSDVMSDSLVLRYGYMMEHTLSTYTWTFQQTSGLRTGSSVGSPITMVTSTKKRLGANPYGFGVSWSGLSPEQIAILAALGISRKS